MGTTALGGPPLGSGPLGSGPLGSGPMSPSSPQPMVGVKQVTSPAHFDEPEDDLAAEMRAIYERIDANGSGSVSKLELISATAKDRVVAAFVLPLVDPDSLLSDESSFDELHVLFQAMAAGKQRIKYADFARYFRKIKEAEASTTVLETDEVREIFDLIDADGNGSISKLELVAAMQRSEKVDQFVLPGVDSSLVMSDERSFDIVDAIFDAIAKGKRRIDFADWQRHFSKVTETAARSSATAERSSKRLFIIGPGFGLQINPRQGKMIEAAGYQVKWCHGIPNPEQPQFPVEPYLGQIKAELDQFQPHLVACASKGGPYIMGLWRHGLWRGPTLLLNAHPTCKQIPEGVNFVLVHGSNDEVYPTPRADLEAVMATGSPNMCFLYYTANSGQLPSGQFSRVGDRHNQESILQFDCLNRLIDAALCQDGPEVHIVRTWRELLSSERLQAERWLGYLPDQHRRFWSSSGEEEDQHLYDVPPDSEEFAAVVAVFKAHPKDTPAYLLSPAATWDAVRAVRIQRVENPTQAAAGPKPYYESLRRSLEDQGITYEPGTHTCWAFHGADAVAVDSIISNPVSGFQPLASGTRGATLWGLGTYFARDAKYVADGGFCGQPGPDGMRRMLMCQLAVGMPCLGDPNHKGVLPFRRRPHRYNSSVDSLSAPEIYILQHPSAANPAYLITFA